MKARYQRASDSGDHFLEYYRKSTENNSLDGKTRELISLTVASVLRCTQSHIWRAFVSGATAKEITDALLLSSLVAASTQLYWDGDNFAKSITAQT